MGEKTTHVTVDVDERGRFTIPEAARRVLSLTETRAVIRLDVRVLEPDDAAGNQATTDAKVDDRGRTTITPASVRDRLGIRGREATVEAQIEKKHARPDGGLP